MPKVDRINLSGDLNLSRIAYGMWRLADVSDTSPSHVQAKVEACLEQGITTMDHADIYGGYTAEEILGNAFRAAPQLKDEVEIITKCGIVAPMGRYAHHTGKHYNTGRDHITQSVEASLTLMDVDRIDLLLIHRPDHFMDAEETGLALDDLVRSGKVAHVGVSNFKPHDFSLLQSAMDTVLVTNQIELSLACLDPFTNGDIAFLQEHRIVPMAWSPLGGGSLMDNSNPALKEELNRIAERDSVDIASVAVAWLLAHPARILPVMGSNNLDRIARFSDALNVTMTREDWFQLYTASQGVEVP